MEAIFQLTSAALTHPGIKRSDNEDFVLFYEPKEREVLENSGSLYIIADGVGGAKQGEKASQYAAEKVLYEYYQHPELLAETRLEAAIFKANRDIFEYVQKTDPSSRMSTTLVAAVILKDRLTIANVGDCRAYLVQGGRPMQVTRDHNLAAEQARTQEGGRPDQFSNRANNQLTRSIGGAKDVEVDLFPDIEIHPGDKVLLCTDGLTRYLQGDDLVHLIGRDSPRLVVERLVDFANRKGGMDNISVLLVAVGNIVGPTQGVPVQRQAPGMKEPGISRRVVPSRQEARSARRKKSRWQLSSWLKSIPWLQKGPLARMPRIALYLLLAMVLMLCLGAGYGIYALSKGGSVENKAGIPLQTISPVGTLSLEQSLPLKPTPTRTKAPTATKVPPWECLVHPPQNAGLMQLMIDTVQSYDDQATYYYYEDCQTSGSSIECGARKELPPGEHNFIRTSWLIVVEIKSQAECKKKEGIIYYLPQH